MKAVVPIVLSFVFSIALNSFGANAEDFLSDEKQYFTGVCEDLLTELNAGNIDSYFLNQANSSEAMIRLLSDYQLIFHPDFGKALLPALAAHGVSAKDFGSLKLKEKLKELRKILSLSEEAMGDLVRATQENILLLKSQFHFGRSENQAKVEFLRVKRLFAAIEKSPEKKVLFDQVLGDVIRSAILQVALIELETILSKIDRQKSYHCDACLPLLFFGTIASGIGAGFAMNHFGILNSITTDVAKDYFGGFAVWMGTFYVSVSKIDQIFEWRRQRAENKFKEFDKNLVLLPLSTSGYSDIAGKYHQLFEDLKAASKSGVLSVEKACEGDFCSINPVELAYLGFVDILDIEAKEVLIREAMNKEKDIPGVRNLRELGAKVRAAPDSYLAQVKFRQALEIWLRDTKAASDLRKRLSTQLENRISKVGESIRALKSRPYLNSVAKATDEDLQKYEFYVAKVNGDLATLLKIEARIEEMRKWGTRLEGRVERLEKMLSALPKDESGWKTKVEEIILDIDTWQD